MFFTKNKILLYLSFTSNDHNLSNQPKISAFFCLIILCFLFAYLSLTVQRFVYSIKLCIKLCFRLIDDAIWFISWSDFTNLILLGTSILSIYILNCLFDALLLFSLTVAYFWYPQSVRAWIFVQSPFLIFAKCTWNQIPSCIIHHSQFK